MAIARFRTTMLAAGVLAAMPMASPAWGIECRSVAGHMEGDPVDAVRRATISKGRMSLAGSFNGGRSPQRSLPCTRLAAGVLCEDRFGPVIVSVVTNRKRMIETVTSPIDGREIAAIAYTCDGALKF